MIPISNGCAVEIRANFQKIIFYQRYSSELEGGFALTLNKVREEKQTVNFVSTFEGKLFPRSGKGFHTEDRETV